ncbi:MAG: GatB/YqeY domain-containing protein [Clostridiales bacterium]|nr:GatB/YqeY domain-containing protein [Clostridiales bacterium]
MNIDDFKKAKIVAMKERNKNAVLALEAVISKLMLITIEKRAKGEKVTEGETLAILQKVEKELLEERESCVKAGREEPIAKLDEQLKTIRKYLPKMLDENEIRAIILQLDDRSIPAVMKHFKQNYQGKCDMRKVNEILKSL